MESFDLLKKLGFSDEFLSKLEQFEMKGIDNQIEDNSYNFSVESFDSDKLIVNQNTVDTAGKKVISSMT